MKAWWEGLKPVERRWAVGIGGIVFLMLNYFFVWPHFGDWKRDQFRLQRAEATNDIYNAELRHADDYKRKIRELQADGSEVLPEDQAIDFVHFYSSRAVNNSIMITSQSPLLTRTNDYSLVQQVNLGVQASETNLVNFLYSLGSGNSMMRVQAMSLHPDPSHMQLGANVTLVAFYQKKAPVPRASGTSPAKTSVAAAPIKAPIPAAPPIVKAPEHPGKTAPSSPAFTSGTNKLAGPLSRPISTANKPGSSTANRP